MLFVLILYIRYYTKTNNTYEIVQVSLNNMTSHILYERHPILIQDRMVNPEEILKTLYKYTYIKKKKVTKKNAPLTICSAKYSLIYSTKRDITVNIIAPKYRKEIMPCDHNLESKKNLDSTNVQYVTIKLKKQQLLVLPYGWIYETNSPHIHITLDDIFSILVHFFYLGTAFCLSRTI